MNPYLEYQFRVRVVNPHGTSVASKCLLTGGLHKQRKERKEANVETKGQTMETIYKQHEPFEREQIQRENENKRRNPFVREPVFTEVMYTDPESNELKSKLVESNELKSRFRIPIRYMK